MVFLAAFSRFAQSLVLVGLLIGCGGLSHGFTKDGGAGNFALQDGGSASSGAKRARFVTDGGAAGGRASDCPVCSAGQVCGPQGQCVCPPYSSLCDGHCIPTSMDPSNCGGCGVKCTGASVCSAGACSASCLPDLKACSSSCVDTQFDSAHCGSCGRACGAGMGCSHGSCVPAAMLGTPPASACAGAGPSVIVTGSQCGSNLAAVTFTWALCSCGDITQGTKLLTDAYDSTLGPYVPGGLGGGVGMNGDFVVEQTGDAWPSGFTIDVSGSLWSSAASGMMSSSDVIARQELHVGGPLDVQRFNVDRDAFVVGDVSGNPLAIKGSLHQPAGASVNGQVTYGSLVHEALTVPPPCACAANELIPVAAIAKAHATDNDNALIGLDAALLTTPAAPQRIDLPCGRYYLSAINVSRDVTIVAHGRTALFIAGDVRSSARLQLGLDPGAELDTFIGGNLSVTALHVGSPNYPALSRTYVGGTSTISVSDNTSIAGNFYAAYAEIAWESPTDAYGAVYAGSFHGLSEVQIHYDRAVLDDSCPPAPPDKCGSCRDCTNQACVGGACGPCTSSDQCCAPLVCAGGKCVVAVL